MFQLAETYDLFGDHFANDISMIPSIMNSNLATASSQSYLNYLLLQHLIFSTCVTFARLLRFPLAVS